MKITDALYLGVRHITEGLDGVLSGDQLGRLRERARFQLLQAYNAGKDARNKRLE